MTSVCAPHPSAFFGRETTEPALLYGGVPVVAVGPPAGATSLEEIVAAMEKERRSLGVERWVIWGMSGGSFLGQLYAQNYPAAVAGLILASSGPYFRLTVEDPDCILSPRNRASSAKLEAAGLLDGEYEMGPTTWELVPGVGWVFRRVSGAALVISPEEPSAELCAIMPALWTFDARPWLGTISAPTLIMCGTADPALAEAGVTYSGCALRRNRRRWSYSAGRASHRSGERDPGVFAVALRTYARPARTLKSADDSGR